MARPDAQELYRLPPEHFTAARDAAAKAAPDKVAAREIKALRKPTVSAWIVNVLASEEPELLAQLVALGPALAQAQAQGEGEQLRQLSAQRRELVDAVTARALELAERAVTAAVRDEVAATLETALADAASAEAVQSGRLVRPLSYAGFGGVDLDGAVAGLPRAAESAPDGVVAAEAAALEAAGRLDDAVRACEQRERERAAAEESATQAAAEVERLRAALQEAQQAAKDAQRARSAADKAAEAAVDEVRRAQRVEEQARGELDRLRRG